MKNFVAITQDQMIIRDGEAVDTRLVGGFSMSGGEWAVHFNAATGVGEVEYIDNRVNEKINEDQFKSRYGYLIDTHTKALNEVERLAAEAAEAADSEDD